MSIEFKIVSQPLYGQRLRQRARRRKPIPRKMKGGRIRLLKTR
jgi:hypothetical protein